MTTPKRNPPTAVSDANPGSRPHENDTTTHRANPSTGERGTPTHDVIARRAYELYRERGGAEGLDLDDWMRAERELQLALPPGVSALAGS
jgi:DUF2934 family protein